MKRIFLVECSAPQWLGVAEKLEAAGHQIVLWSGLKTMEAAVRQTTRNCLFYDTALAKKGLDSSGNLPFSGGFDHHCQDVWSSSAHMVYDQMNRFDHSRDWNVLERSQVFLRTLLHWREILGTLKPDLIIVPTPPHVVYDFILLELANRIGIESLVFHRAAPILPSHSIVQRNFGGEFVDTSRPASSSVSLNADVFIEETVQRLQADYGASPPAKRVREYTDAKRASLVGGVARLAVALIKVAVSELARKQYFEVNYGPLVKEKGKTIEDSYVGRFSGTKYYLQRIREWLYNRKLESYYESRTSLSKDAPAIYVPLARQPERTSNPQAGIFTNQILMVQLLAKNLPPGWRIWVRDHPTQFQPNWVVNPYRSRAYYESLLSIPQVELVSTTLDPFELIDSSAMVASIGGTVSVEAVSRGKPALVFGEAWYQGLKGVYLVKNEADLKEAMGSLPTWGRAEPRFVEEFLQSFIKRGFEGEADHPTAGFLLSQEENENNLADAILEFIESD